jgi:hypothetical protein
MRIARFDDNLVGVVLDGLEPVYFSAWDKRQEANTRELILGVHELIA